MDTECWNRGESLNASKKKLCKSEEISSAINIFELAKNVGLFSHWLPIYLNWFKCPCLRGVNMAN